MKFLTVLTVIFILTSVPVISSATTYPAWYFTDATLNYTAYQYYGINATVPNAIWNFSYKISSTINGLFNYTYYEKSGKISLTRYGNGSVIDPDGFPALNITDLNMLNSGNVSFLGKVSVGTKSVYVITNITMATYSGNVQVDELIVKNSPYNGMEHIFYYNYSMYSGVLISQKEIVLNQNNYTVIYFYLIYTNIPLSRVTLVQIFIEFTLAIVFVVALIYFFKRYRKINYM